MYRPGSTNVVIDGDFAVFFYDETNGEAAREGFEAILGEEYDRLTAFRLAREGTLQAFEPWREGPHFHADPVTVEVAVAPPLEPAEKKPWKWKRAPAKALLELPSGRLRIETEATLADPAAHPPAVMELPPGSYAMKLERVDWERMRGGKLEAYEGPDAVVTLEPWPAKKRKKYEPANPFFAWDERAGGRRPRWEGLYEVGDGVFRGEVIAAHMEGERGRRVAVNMDRAAYDRLGLERGMRLEVEVDGARWAVLCQGRMIPLAADTFLGRDGYERLAELHPGLLVGYQASTAIPGAEKPTDPLAYRPYDFFEVATISEETAAYVADDGDFNRLFRLDRGTPIEVRIVGERFFERGPSADDWTAQDGELRCRVRWCPDTALLLNGGLKALRAAGLEDEDVLELVVGGEKRNVFDRWYVSRDRERLGSAEGSEALKPFQPDEGDEEEAPRPSGVEGALPPETPEEVEARLRAQTRRRYHPDDLLHPPLYLEFGRDPDFEGAGTIILRSLLGFGGPFGMRGPWGPEDIHLDLEPGDEAVLRKP